MADLFDEHADEVREERAPLADRMRPRTLDEFAGQEHFLGEGKLLRRAIEADRVTSVLFYGPPGTGKTTLAQIIANTTEAHFSSLNAVLSGVNDLREAIQTAKNRLKHHQTRTILFVDEVHRFNTAQQDALLPHVEDGTVTFIGATTENPYFEVNDALVSRSRVFELEPLDDGDLRQIAAMALTDEERGYGDRDVEVTEDALDHIIDTANGDARSVLNALELAIETTEPTGNGGIAIDLSVAEDSIQQRAVLYDKEGDAHFDTISAFIKSLRGSDPDAALYWLARMLYAGEEPRSILRRMLIFAAEDVGMADPRALQVAQSAAAGFDYVGMPEGRFMIAECCLYLATAPKSNTTFSYFDALDHVREEQTEDIPNHLKDPTRDKEELGHGDGYKYPHAYQQHYTSQQYLPNEMQGTYFYEPTEQGYEKTVAQRLEQWRERDFDEDVVKRAQKYADAAREEEEEETP
ncbi:MAG: AAA family ATPase [Bacteroidetes bacterium SW_9_63_38]|nr:MAG: AAA family ATPase [Bacteroidetes bacterium SW_9_63_38]